MQRESVFPWGTAPSETLADLCIEAAKRRWVRGSIRRFLLNNFASATSVRDIIVDGFRLRCHYADNDTERDLCIVGTEKHAAEMAMLMGHLEPGDTFIDAGANCGWFTLNGARKVGPFGRVVAIEPMSEMMDRLWFNVRANELSNVIPVAAALSDESGQMTLRVNAKQRGMSGHHPECGSGVEHVRTLTLPDILNVEARTGCALMKIDVEGHEDRAILPMLRDAEPALWPRKIFMETRHSDRWQSDCIETLCQNGYSVLWQEKGDALLTL